MHTELTEHCQLLSIGTLQAVDVNCGFMKSVVELKVCTQHCFMLFIKSDTCNIIFGRSVALLKNSGLTVSSQLSHNLVFPVELQIYSKLY